VTALPVIVGEEISSREGEIAVLFVKEWIPLSLSMEETTARIREQAGLVYIPHPLARDVPTALRRENLEAIIEEVDILEGFSAHVLCEADNRAAQDIARQCAIPPAAGSDAHFAREIGRAGAELDDFTTPQELLQSLQRGNIFGHRSPYPFSAVTCGLSYIDKFRQFLRKARRPDSKPDAILSNSTHARFG